jgi:hypothetical protein
VKDLTVVENKPLRLPNGTPAHEFEIAGTLSGLPFNYACRCTTHGGLWIQAQVSSQSGKIGDHLAAILQPLSYQPHEDKPVEVPVDARTFLDGGSKAWMSHDCARIMGNWSDRYLQSGVRKGEMERVWRPMMNFVTTHEMTVTQFVREGDKIHLAGFAVVNGVFKVPIGAATIIKENGEWKWYGNQREVAP